MRNKYLILLTVTFFFLFNINFVFAEQLNIKSTKTKEIVSKDSKGDPVKFEINILVEYTILNNNNTLLDTKIEKKNIYNNDSDPFKLEQTENIILQNLSESVGDTIISSIINLDDN